MDKYEEKARKIMERGDAMLAGKKRSKVSVAHRTAAITFGTAAVLAIGIAVQAILTPRKPEPKKREIVTEMQEITTAAASGTTTSKTFVSVAATSAPVTTAEASTTATADTSAPEETTEVSSAANVSQTSTAAATSHASTNAVTSQTTAYATTAIQETTTTVPSDMTYLDFVAANVKELTLFGDKTYKLWQYHYIPSANRVFLSPKTKFITDGNVGEFVADVSVKPAEYTGQLPERIKGKVCQIGNMSADNVVTIKFEGTDTNLIYMNEDYAPTSLGQLIDDFDMDNTLHFVDIHDDQLNKCRVDYQKAFDILTSNRKTSISKGTNLNMVIKYGFHAESTVIPDLFFYFIVDEKGHLRIDTSSGNNGKTYTENVYKCTIGKETAKEFIEYVENNS